MREIRSRNFNIDIVVKILVLSGFALFFFLTIKSGKVSMYVHPRNIPYIGFAAAAMMIIAIFLLPEVFKPQRTKANLIPLIFFIVPLVMAFAVPAQPFDSSSLSYGELKLANIEGDNTDSSDEQEFQEEDEFVDGDIYQDENAVNSNNSALELQDGVIVMDSSNFVRWIQEINDNAEQYKGKKIEVTGFVLKDKQFKNNEFVPARMMMVCCAADMQPVGLLCRYNNVTVLKEDTWVKVTGTIEKTQFNGDAIPVINAIHVEKADKPENDYVYPF